MQRCATGCIGAYLGIRITQPINNEVRWESTRKLNRNVEGLTLPRTNYNFVRDKPVHGRAGLGAANRHKTLQCGHLLRHRLLLPEAFKTTAKYLKCRHGRE